MTPTFHIVQLDPQCLKLVLNEDPTPTAYKLDLAYILMKYIHCDSRYYLYEIFMPYVFKMSIAIH